MCSRTEDPVYCDTELRFAQYELEPPQLVARHHDPARRHARQGAPAAVEDLARRAAGEARRQGRLHPARGRGGPRHARPCAGSVPRKAGDYDVTLTAVDLAGQRRYGRGDDRGPQAQAEDAETLDRGVLARLPRSHAPRPDHPLHGQGRRGQDLRGGCDRAPLRGRGAAHDRPLHGPRPLARGLARSARRLDADAGRRQPVGPAGAGAGRARAQLVGGPGVARRAVRRPGRRPHRGRGADRPAGRRRAVQPAAAQAPRRGRRLGRRDRRLRAHGRDAAAAVVPRRRALVARQGLRARARSCWPPRGRSRARSSTSSCPTSGSSARSSAWSRT